MIKYQLSWLKIVLMNSVNLLGKYLIDHLRKQLLQWTWR